MFHGVTNGLVETLVLGVDVHPPFAYYSVGGWDDLAIQRKEKKERSRHARVDGKGMKSSGERLTFSRIKFG